MEDNCLLLQTLFQVAHGLASPLYVCFVDLQKAYDTVDRSKLYGALATELGVVPGLVAIFRRMYTDVRA